MRATTFFSSLVLIATGICAPRSTHAAPVAQRVSSGTDEPGCGDTIKAALAYAALHPDRVDRLRSQAAWKDLAPILGVKARSNQSTLSLDKTTLTGGETEKATGDVVEVEISGEWNLPGLVFNPEVLDVNALVDQQRGLAQFVIDTYYARKRLLVHLTYLPATEPAALALQVLEVDELTMKLDAVTGGYFTRKRRSRDD